MVTPFPHSLQQQTVFWHVLKWEIIPLLCCTILAEPVGSVKPKINVQDKLQTREMAQGAGFALLCPAQSYPMPAYRYYSVYILHLPCMLCDHFVCTEFFRLSNLYQVRPWHNKIIKAIISLASFPTRQFSNYKACLVVHITLLLHLQSL